MWLGKVNDFLALTRLPEEQAVIYTIMLLTGNARAWWQSEFQKRGNTRPNTVAELAAAHQISFRVSIEGTEGHDRVGETSAETGRDSNILHGTFEDDHVQNLRFS